MAGSSARVSNTNLAGGAFMARSTWLISTFALVGGNQELASSKLQSLHSLAGLQLPHTLFKTPYSPSYCRLHKIRVFYIIYSLWLKSAQNQIAGLRLSPARPRPTFPRKPGPAAQRSPTHHQHSAWTLLRDFDYGLI